MTWRFNIMLVAIISTFLLTLSQQTICRKFPINIKPISNHFHRQTFGTGPGGCVVYGYPSTGGVLVKEADLLDMLFLSVSRSHESQRSPSLNEEDRFCKLMRRTGAKWWSSRED
ncbi:hypothetical protein N7508_007186 [Penicillium antarcticum]|uniref:uncharacterized protein n=1 Tax=Penicillium antarcticum TaxID=416450 RepID=UPI0023885EC0|nr:uncharacterized protein N7508_007186 [Penicillium antarcticum]KAJ5302323.1 hypothetical protein N7508_007186 [Penicillium antarcticum]